MALSSFGQRRRGGRGEGNFLESDMRAVTILVLAVLAVLAGCASPTQQSVESVAAENGRCANFSRENLQTRSLLVAYRTHCIKDTPLGL